MKLKAISVVIIAGAAALASAQLSDRPIGVGARIGTFLPTDSTAQTAGNSWLDIGLDFEIKRLSPSASLRVSLDYAYRGGYRSLPLLLNYYVRRGPIYALVGAGGNFNRIPENGGSTYTTTSVAYDIGVGYDIMKNAGAPIFLEGRFFGNQKTELDGFGVFLGIRI